MTEIKNQYNSEGKKDGYWEWYYNNGTLMCRGNYINGDYDGYWEEYYGDGNTWSKGNFINGTRDGYWEFYNRDGRLDEIIFYDNN